ncbi:MAG: hypothetical protein ACLPWS_06770 [Rhodomicrobium sp.]
MMTADTRLWMYRNGEACLFEHPGHVPAGQGWQRFPAPASDSEPLPETPRVNLPEPGPDQELTDQEKLDRMSRQRLMQVAADCGVHFGSSWTKAQLKHAIIEVLNDNGP